jgi:hypothetical protein
MLTPGATRWVSITDDIQQCRVKAMMSDDTYFYASMEFCGMWRRPLSTITLGVENEKPAEDPCAFNLAVTPNPTSATARVRFTLRAAGDVVISLFDAQGAQRRVIADGMMAQGEHELLLDASEMASGAYFVQIESAEQSQTVRLILMR